MWILGLKGPDIQATQNREEVPVHKLSVLDVEKASFTPLVFSTTGGMAVECK